MKLYLISDNMDTYTGMRLAGIEGVVIHEMQDFINAFNDILNKSDYGIILITERYYIEHFNLISEVKLSRRLPLIISIPDRHGSINNADFITTYINDAIGLKL